MKRSQFLKYISLLGVGMSALRKIFSQNIFLPDSDPTTTDILGPAYRPGAPIRTNVNPADFAGNKLHLTGTIYKDDGKTAFNNCFIEIWQCNEKGEYDNLSPDYIYRGATYTTDEGKYHFITSKPIAYIGDVAKQTYRPAHIHMRISGGEGQQDLVTQIYFKGDPHIPEDEFASSPRSAKRILNIIKTESREDSVRFDIVMQKEFPLSDEAWDKITGIYDLGNGTNARQYRKGDLLFMDVNELIQEPMYYKGNNMFEDGTGDIKVRFEPQPDGATKAIGTFVDDNNVTQHFNVVKVLDFKE